MRSTCHYLCSPAPILAYPSHLLGNLSDHAGPGTIVQQGAVLSGRKWGEVIGEVQSIGDQVPQLDQVPAVRNVSLHVWLDVHERRVLRDKGTGNGSKVLQSKGRTIGSVTAHQI